MVRWIAAAAFAAAASLARPAHADVPVAEASGPRNAVYGVVGLAAPLGGAGLEAVRRFGSAFEVSAGLGAGITALRAHSGSPLQWSVMPRLRVGSTPRHSLTFGAGVSGGNIGDIPLWCDEYCDAPGTSYPTHYWLWANFEIGGEHWINRFAIRYFTGYARGCQLDSCTALGLPYVGVGFGVAF
jgi:hypothetical protein